MVFFSQPYIDKTLPKLKEFHDQYLAAVA
jgi:hypothetical protein